VRPSFKLDSIRTSRLVLLRLGEADVADLVAMHRNRTVMSTLGGLQDEATTRSGVARVSE